MDRLHGPAARTRDPYRRGGARHDARARAAAWDRRRRGAGAAARAREPQRRAPRRRTLGHGRPDRGATCAARWSSHRSRWRSCCWSAPGLLLASFQRLLGVDPGFVAEQVLTGRVESARHALSRRCGAAVVCERALARVRALPGVESAGISSYLPFSWDSSSSVIIPEGYAPKPGESVVSPNQLYVSPGYLDALKVPLKRGRFFTDSDTAERPTGRHRRRTAGERGSGPNQDPVGRRMYMPDEPEDVEKPGPKVTWLQVVGVVGAVKLRGLEEGENARAGAYYQAYAQAPTRGIGWAIRSRGDARRSRRRCSARSRRSTRSCADRCVRDVRARRQVAQPAPGADVPVARVRRGRAAARGGRAVRRPGVPREPAHARDRHPHGARQRTRGILRLVLGEAGGSSRWARRRARRRARAAQRDRRATLWRGRARSARDARGRGRPGRHVASSRASGRPGAPCRSARSSHCRASNPGKQAFRFAKYLPAKENRAAPAVA